MTEKWPHLPNAPVTEAVIEFQFGILDNVTMDMLSEIADQLKADYPHQEEKKSSIFRATITDSGPETEIYDQGLIGISAKNHNKQKIVQLFRDRFSFSHLPPYKDWKQLEADAIKIWQIFLDKTNIHDINRVGVRFINKIELDLPIDDFNNYLVGAPIVPEGLPQNIGTFDQRIIIPNHEIMADAIINMSMHGLDKEKNVVPIVLDLDVGKVDIIKADQDNIHNILSDLRNYKNDLFFRSITDRVVRKYQ